MTPFAIWSQCRPEISNSSGCNDDVALHTDFDEQRLVEMSGLIDDIIQNVVNSSSAQLRSTLTLMERNRHEERLRHHSDQLRKGLSQIEAKTSAIVAEALAPVLSDLHRSRIVTDFAKILKKVLSEFADQSLTVSAPVELHEKLSGALQFQSIDAELKANDEAQIVLTGSNLVLRADLDQWVRDFTEVAA